MDDKKIKGDLILPMPLITASGTTTITATGAGIERELIFPNDSTSEQIVSTLAYELGVDFKPPFKEQIMEKVDVAKTYTNEFEIGITWKEGFKFKISRAPKKIIKSFIKK